MMTKITVADGQNVFDLAIQFYGSVEGAEKIYQDNPEVSFDAELSAGQEIQIDESFVVDKQILDEINKHDLKFNTGN